MDMTEAERRIADNAVVYAKENRARIVRERTDPMVYVPEDCPVSVFMAGSPGAGKTEASIELLEGLSKDGNQILRIDPDELRALIPGYTGANAWLFQKAVVPIVEAIHDKALKKGQSFVMDGTLSSYSVANRNIERSLRKGRTVQILYVYQEPQQAWKFVLAREQAEGRRIEPETFVSQYFAARQVVNRLKRDFGKDIGVDLLMKNNDGSHRFYKAGVDQIDNHIPERYKESDVRQMLGLSD